MSALSRFNVSVSGRENAPVLLFAHGFGCDQTMWRLVAPEFEEQYRVVLFDHIGCGDADRCGFDPDEYASLDRYAEDVVAICRELDVCDVTFVGHSVSAMIGVLAQIATPGLFAALVLVGPSARYIDDGPRGTDGPYQGGFSRSDIDELLELMDSNRLGWQEPLSGLVMSGTDQPAVKDEIEAIFCRADPIIARDFAKVTFLGDNRDDVGRVTVPTLVLQSRSDVIAPMSAGEFVHERIPDSEFVVVDTVGHCPQLSAPADTVGAISRFLRRLRATQPATSSSS